MQDKISSDPTLVSSISIYYVLTSYLKDGSNWTILIDLKSSIPQMQLQNISVILMKHVKQRMKYVYCLQEMYVRDSKNFLLMPW